MNVGPLVKDLLPVTCARRTLVAPIPLEAECDAFLRTANFDSEISTK
jgi:hypothetical protein